ncbi:sialin-like [Bolinopsis microptera]|uniref:sialin-like n=1 Tax=Bolinopsis microptera TaxID=2820187 RepID=UPI00307A23F7
MKGEIFPLLGGRRENCAPNKTSVKSVKPAGWFRYVIVLLVCCGFIMDYILRMNISFALDSDMVAAPEHCTENETRCWSQEQQGYVLSSFFWGYWATQLPGAVICCYFGASKVFGIGLFIAILATFLCPFISGVNFWLFIALRLFIGLGQGVTFPVALNIIATWAPTSQFATFSALSSGGQYLGAVLANSVSGLLASGSFLEGWPSLFYVYGGCGVLWALLWFVFVRDDPATSYWTSNAEREYLAATTVPKKAVQISEIPWKSILKSGRFRSTCVMHMCNGYGFFMLLSDIPKFMIEVLQYNMKDSGFIASLPYVMIYLGYTSGGYFSDLLIRNGILSKTWTRKFCSVAAQIIPAILLAAMAYCENNVPILILLNITMYFQGYANLCYYVNYVDLSPRFSVILCGIGNGLSAVAGILGPIAVGFLVNDVDPDDYEKLHERWKIAFLSASAVWMFGSVQYCVFGSAEVQPWNSHGLEEETSVRDEDIMYTDVEA